MIPPCGVPSAVGVSILLNATPDLSHFPSYGLVDLYIIYKPLVVNMVETTLDVSGILVTYNHAEVCQFSRGDDVSTPVSAIIAVATCSLTPGMVCRRSYCLGKCSLQSQVSSF